MVNSIVLDVTKRVRELAKQTLPPTIRLILSELKPPMIERRAAERRVRKLSGSRVASGPFKSMKYLRKTSDDAHYAARLLGTYELELAPIIESFASKQFSRIIVVGAAEGYYAVGLARRHAGVQVFAFEATERGRRLLTRMAELNGTRRTVHVKGYCDETALSGVMSPNENCLVVMDIEGGEALLLDPDKIPALREAEVLVELHDFIVSNVYEQIAKRFQATHRLALTWERPRTPEDFPFPWLLKGNPRDLVRFISLMDEARPAKMRWLHMEPLRPNRSEASLPDTV